MSTIANWGQQPNEGEKAFAAFKVYRDLGRSRSLRLAAREVGKSKGLLDKWSRKHGWVARCAAWDLESEAQAASKHAAAVLDATDRHGKLARAVLGRAAAELGAYQAGACPRCKRGPKDLTPSQVAAWVRVGVDVERTALGLGSTTASPGVQINVQTTVVAGAVSNLVILRDPDTQRLATDLLARMKALQPATTLRNVGEGAHESAERIPTGRLHIEARAQAFEDRRLDHEARGATDPLEEQRRAAAAADPDAASVVEVPSSIRAPTLPTVIEELGSDGFEDDDGDLF